MMKVVAYDLSKIGARWVFLGNKVYVDPLYLDAYKAEHPEVSITPTKTEDIHIEKRTEFN